MKAENNRLVGFLELAALVGLGVSLVFILKNMLAKPEFEAGQIPSYPGPTDQAAPIPTNPGPIDNGMPTPTVAAIAPPKCEFPGFFTVSTQVAPPAGEYTFSEPRVVLTSEGTLGIAGWLPDSKRLLLTRDTLHSTQEIFTYDVFSGEEKLYAERSISSSTNKPAWLEDLQAVAYADRSNPLQEPAVEEELRISYGDPKASERISPKILGYSMSSNGSTLVYFSPAAENQPQIWSAGTKTAQFLPLHFENWIYSKPFNVLPAGRILWTAINPQGSFIAYCGSQFFIENLTNDRLCEFELESKEGTLFASNLSLWSPDGRFLAQVIFESVVRVFHGGFVAILDFSTGQIILPAIESNYIFDLTWSPDSKTLAVLGRTTPRDPNAASVFIGIINQGEFQVIKSSFPLGGGRERLGIAWSPDNHMIAVNCSVVDEKVTSTVQDRICIIDVKP